jgi:hypothetical protein
LEGDLTFFRHKRQIKFESGNLSIETIRETSKKYGFSPVNITHNDQKDAFQKVKTERNSLAHGDKTFSDCGNNYSFSELEAYKNYVFEYLEKVLQSIETFINSQGYLQTTTL